MEELAAREKDMIVNLQFRYVKTIHIKLLIPPWQLDEIVKL